MPISFKNKLAFLTQVPISNASLGLLPFQDGTSPSSITSDKEELKELAKTMCTNPRKAEKFKKPCDDGQKLKDGKFQLEKTYKKDLESMPVNEHLETFKLSLQSCATVRSDYYSNMDRSKNSAELIKRAEQGALEEEQKCNELSWPLSHLLFYAVNSIFGTSWDEEAWQKRMQYKAYLTHAQFQKDSDNEYNKASEEIDIETGRQIKFLQAQ